MKVKRPVGVLCFIVVIGTARQACSQGTMVRQTPASATRDSSGSLKKDDSVSVSASGAMARAVVVLADGSAPEDLVEIYGGCGGAQRFIAIADSKGRVTFNPNVLAGIAGGEVNGCVVHAALDGFRSETKAVTEMNAKSASPEVIRNGLDTRLHFILKLGKIVLQPRSSDANGVTSSAGGQAGKAQRKLYEKALDEAAGQDWSNAIASLKKVTSAYPGYSSAWLSLGVLQQSGGDHTNAEKSFLEAARADPKFALPYIRAAALESTQGDWRATLDHSRKAIDINPTAFPNAYALNALANISLQDIDAAEKSAQEGIKLDTEHQYPELEYSLGIVLYSKKDVDGATKHLQAYVEQSPNGSNATGARNQLAQMRAEAIAASPSSISAGNLNPPSSGLGVPAGPSAASSLIQERNAPLLMKTPNHTCLETIARGQIDLRGRLHQAETVRVDVAISDGREIYGEADGKRFSNEGLAEMLRYSFSTTGLFSSIARALIAGNQLNIEPAGEEVLNGETVLRYNFHMLPGAAGWNVQYGKESGHAGEQGWFLVDKVSLVLRRVAVEAVEVPHNLKLKNLRAVIDYEMETIADRRVLLPEVAQVNVQEQSGSERVSRIFFDHCRGFEAESTLSFADNPDAASKQSRERPTLPAGMDVSVSLLLPLTPATATGTDLITANVAEPVVVKGRELIARGAIIEGHVRPRRGENALVIELDRVKTRDGWAPFYAHLLSVTSSVTIETDVGDPPRTGVSGKLVDPEVPGVARIVFSSKSAELPSGTRMLWKTELLVAPAEARRPQLNTEVNLH